MAVSKNPKQFIKSIPELKECPSPLLILATDEIRKERICNLLLQRFFVANGTLSTNELKVEKISAATLNAEKMSAFEENSHAISLFSSMRFIMIEDVQDFTADNYKSFIKILDRLSPHIKCVLKGTKLASNSVFKRYFVEKELIVELEDISGFELKRWTERELNNVGIKKYDPEVVDSLAEGSNGSLDQLVKMVEHLALFVSGDEVHIADMEELFPAHISPNEFQFVDLLARRKMLLSEILMSSLFRQGKNPFGLLALTARTMLTLFQIRALERSGKNAFQVRQALNMPPWLFNKQAPLANNFSLEELQSALAALVITDNKMKNRSLGAEMVFSGLIDRVCSKSSSR